MKYDVFISYRRDGGEYTAKILRDRLEELGYAVFFDVESLRSGDFNTKLYSVIDECRDFILILSPGALDRCQSEDDWVRREAEYALERGKNIVPVMLRGFEFPEVLPSSIEPLRFKNGIQANTEFFEAFIQKLQSFLQTKPPLSRRVTQNTLFKRTLPVFLALLLLSALGVGAYVLLNRSAALYPRTEAEKDLVDEALYYIEMNTKRLDLMADAAYKALDETRRYIASGSVSAAALNNQLDISAQLISDSAAQLTAPSDRLLEQLSGSPLPPADFLGMYDGLTATADQWLDDIEQLRWLTGPESVYSDSETLKMLDYYQVIWDEDLRASGYATNELLLGVTDRAALNDFLYQYLPTLTRVPLSAASWSEDGEALSSAQDECWNKQQAAMQGLNSILGDQTAALAILREYFIQQCMEQGMTRAQAEEFTEQLLAGDRDRRSDQDELSDEEIEAVKEAVLREGMVQKYVDRGLLQPEAEKFVDEYLLPRLAQAREQYAPAPGDSENVLWTKLAGHMALQLYGWAEPCVDALEELVGDSDPYAADYLPALRAFVRATGFDRIDYGAMVVAWDAPNRVNQAFRIGDIIVALDGQPCRTAEDCISYRDALSGPSWTATVLRLNPSDGFERLDLELTADMPPVELRSLNVSLDKEENDGISS